MNKSKVTECEKCLNKDKSIFCNIHGTVINDIDNKKVVNTFKKGQNLFFQGNPPFGIYCIKSGKIKISKSGTEGKESIVRIAGPGDILGHRSLFSSENYNATATIIEDAVVCFIDKHLIYEKMREEPTLSLNIIHKLSIEMGTAETKTASMFQKDVTERLAEFLLSLMKTYGVEENGRCRLDIKLTREEIASLIGTANETVIRLISKLKSSGIIAQEGKTLYILDKEQLLETANLSY